MQKFLIPVRIDVEMVVEVKTHVEVEAASKEEAEDLVEEMGQTPEVLVSLLEKNINFTPKFEINQEYLNQDIKLTLSDTAPDPEPTTGGKITYIEVNRN